MGKVKDLVGKKFGRLTVIEQHGFTEKNEHGSKQAIWYCKCDCGNYCEIPSGTLTRKRNNHSCGCLAKEHLKDMAKGNITHGMSNTGLYRSYKAMMSRCYRKKDIHYNAYGKRGIVVCKEWKDNSKAFIEWGLSNGWREHLTLERIDVNGNYEPSNCKWIPMKDQYDNKRQNVMITFNGETHNATYWGRKFNINPQAIRWRYRHGWNIERIFELPSPAPFKPQESEDKK